MNNSEIFKVNENGILENSSHGDLIKAPLTASTSHRKCSLWKIDYRVIVTSRESQATLYYRVVIIAKRKSLFVIERSPFGSGWASHKLNFIFILCASYSNKFKNIFDDRNQFETGSLIELKINSNFMRQLFCERKNSLLFIVY